MPRCCCDEIKLESCVSFEKEWFQGYDVDETMMPGLEYGKMHKVRK